MGVFICSGRSLTAPVVWGVFIRSGRSLTAPVVWPGQETGHSEQLSLDRNLKPNDCLSWL